ncbi:cupin domain-containing protein [Natronomonas sp. EA1]|uniref:cupin domain-containing protein n=1 Tax=Natronomonas sp. EA1 TaxID=3421655 RepID=UPI003EBF1D09
MTDDYGHLPADAAPDAPSPTRHKFEVDEAFSITEFGFNVFVADPGQRLPWGTHSHPDHEELFYVIEGQVSFETPDREYVVEAGEVFFVPRDHPQKGVAVGDVPARVVAVGAPKATDDAVIEEECPECGEMTGRTFDEEDGAYLLYCAECGEQVDRLVSGPE